MTYTTNSSGRISNMDKPGIWYLASDGKPYEFRHDTFGSASSSISMPVRQKDADRAGTTIEVGPDYNRWEISYNDNGYITSMKNVSTRR